ncbi:hypothetical protein MRB53_014050 [Persea americana]|uniref:Uncharacterized protein n=1 Tax=Persea americana TaxID=3435 RepID=A0ACC2KA85_PERAE|nr:hypothetical protein MRB53_014050 [Persea americana]
MSDLLPTSPLPAPSNEHSSTSPLAPPSAQKIIHPMTTRTKDNTRIPKAFEDFITTRYLLPRGGSRGETCVLLPSSKDKSDKEREMDGYNENNPTMMKPGGFQDAPKEG